MAKFNETTFSIILVIVNVLYFGTIFGLIKFAPNYITMLHTSVGILISLFLLYRFNPFYARPTFSELDSRIAFSAGTFLFMNSALGLYITKMITNIKPKMNPIVILKNVINPSEN